MCLSVARRGWVDTKSVMFFEDKPSDLWNSIAAKNIRQSVFDGSFAFLPERDMSEYRKANLANNPALDSGHVRRSIPRRAGLALRPPHEY